MAHTNDQDEDRELMRRIARKDVAAYQRLLTKHLATYTRFAERMLGGHNDAKDVMQEICLKLWDQPEAWRPDARFTTWLYRVLFNACIDHQRKAGKLVYGYEGDTEDARLNQEQILIRQQKMQSIRDALQQLPERQRAALLLCYYHELSNEEAAQAMEVTLGALQQLLFRARQNVKHVLIAHDKAEAAHG